MIAAVRTGRVFWIALLATVLVGALACAAEDTGPSAAEIKDIVESAVGASMSGQLTAADVQKIVDESSGGQLSAADVQKIVDESSGGQLSAADVQRIVADSTSGQLSAADVQKIVDASTSGQLTAAQVQGIVRESTAGQLTAAQVQKIVDDSVAGQLSADDVQKIVAASTSGQLTADDVQSIVQASTGGQLTAADVEKIVAASTSGQLTTADVQKIINESVSAAVDEARKATAAAEAAAMDASKALAAVQPTKETIIFGDLNWPSALLQNRIAQYIVEKGYGYPTDVKFGATLPLFQGLQRGDTHVTMEIWLPNQDEAWNAAREEGAVLSVGKSLGSDWQSSFVIPAYLQEQYPDLDSIEDLKDDQYKQLFATAETGGKARLVSCVIGWSCEDVNAKQIEAYGLTDHVHVINPGDGAALNADIYGAYERQEPWLGYQWGTNDPALKLDLVRLEEPAYSDQCWFTTKACAYEDATILIAVNPDLPGKAPDVIEMLRKWDFNIDVFKEAVRWQDDNPDADTNDTAIWWLNSKTDIWTGWVTAEAATAIQASLAANEIADGWPTE